MSHSTTDIRNVALVGDAGTGKTTLLDALLHAAGAVSTRGSIERGTTVSDFDALERERGHSIDAAIAGADHGGTRLNLIDTPGHIDFRGQALLALAAVETVCLVVNADGITGHGARRLMDDARARDLCRIIVVNKIDQLTDANAVLDTLRADFGAEVLPLNLPADGASRVVSCFTGHEGTSDAGPVSAWHQRIIDQVVEINETVMDHFLDLGEEGLTAAELHEAFEQCLREGHLVPVCFVSATTGAGVGELLDIAEHWLPNPTEANPPHFVKGPEAKPITAAPDPQAHVIADVFKIVHDPFVGKLGVFRVYQGTVRRDSQLFVDDGRKPFKVSHLFRLNGKEHVEISQAVPGDIAAVAKVDELHFDAILHDSHDEDEIRLEPLKFPTPMFGLAVEVAAKGQEQKLSTGLHKLAEEDPACVVEHNGETHETVIRGQSDLHLRVLLQRLQQRFGVDVKTHPPRIAYRETVAAPAEGHCRHKKQTGGAGQFGEVFLRIEPLPRGAGFEFANEVRGGTIPGQFLPAVEKGVRQVLTTGAIAGFPMQDVKVVVYDGKHHPVDSKEIAFIAAGKKAFLDAIAKARPQVLEPIVDLEVTVPDTHVGDVSGGLATRRARINGSEVVRNGEMAVRAQTPISELDGYAAELNSVTGGRGRYSLEFSHYEPVPDAVQQKLCQQYRPTADDD
jgi:elongation factor G